MNTLPITPFDKHSENFNHGPNVWKKLRMFSFINAQMKTKHLLKGNQYLNQKTLYRDSNTHSVAVKLSCGLGTKQQFQSKQGWDWAAGSGLRLWEPRHTVGAPALKLP